MPYRAQPPAVGALNVIDLIIVYIITWLQCCIFDIVTCSTNEQLVYDEDLAFFRWCRAAA
jgi:hypothetical protein